MRRELLLQECKRRIVVSRHGAGWSCPLGAQPTPVCVGGVLFRVSADDCWLFTLILSANQVRKYSVGCTHL